MSGHSHWSTIKRAKATEDDKRGKIFSKMSQMISVAAKDGGGDPDSNAKLRMIIEKAKDANMPKDNIERAIKKGTGELGGERLEEVTFEAFGSGKVGIIIEGITDNKNRTLAEVKQILNHNNGKLAGEGSVKWLFDRKGVLLIKDEGKDIEELELEVIEAGAEDFNIEDDALVVYTTPDDLEKVKKALEEKGIKIESHSLDWVAKETMNVKQKDRDAFLRIYDALDENESIHDIYTNLK